MTKKSRREYKLANQIRKYELMKLARTADVKWRGHYANMSVGRDGRYSAIARKMVGL